MRRVSFPLLLVLLFLMFAVGRANAATLATDIESHLPVAGANIWCPASQQEWDADPYGGDGVLGYTFVSGPDTGDIHLSYTTCVLLRGTDRGTDWAEAAATLYHEWVHSALHDLDEGDTECLSLYFYRYALRHFWGESSAQAQAAYQEAWSVHVRRGLEYPAYKGWCDQFPPDPVP